MELSYKINQSALRFKLVSPGWPTDRVQQFGYSGHSCAIWVTGSVPAYQSPSSINERWARGQVARSVWLHPLCSCLSPQAWSQCSSGDGDTRQPDGLTSERTRSESDSWAERWGPDQFPQACQQREGGDNEGEEDGSMMDGVRTALSKEQQGRNEKWGQRGWEGLPRPQSLP